MLKELFRNYIANGSSMYVTMVDASKAFDKVNRLFNVYMDDLSVNLNKLQIVCLYAGTLINHLMYADDLSTFPPSVARLRKLTYCSAKFNITYNAKTYFSMVIENKPQYMKHVHCIHLNNHPLPYTTKYKYLGHIINNNLTDDDDIARKKDAFYAQANVLARKWCLCKISTKITLFQA